MRILLTEDDAVLADVVGDFLREEGHDVTRTADFGAARELAAAGAWDLCIVDPAGSSYNELRAEDAASIRAVGSCAPVVLTTGRAWAHNTRADELGVLKILSKPYDLLALTHVLDTLVGHSLDESAQTESAQPAAAARSAATSTLWSEDSGMR